MSFAFVSLPDLSDFADEAAEAIVEGAALILRDEVVLGMERAPARTGELYFVPGTRTLYRASAPGEPPAVRTGRYRNSWQTTPAIRTKTGLRAFAFSDLTVSNGRYVLGDLLDGGTRRMRARPHIERAVTRGAERIEKELLR